MLGRKGEKALLLVGHEKVPHGFGLTGDPSHTADGAGNCRGPPKPWTSISFLSYSILDWAEGESLCAFVGILRDSGILMKTLSHYSRSVSLLE